MKRATLFEPMPQARKQKRRVRLPKREPVYLVVPSAILKELAKGKTVEKACLAALAKSVRSDVDWRMQIQEWFHDWSALGWFCRRSGL